MIVRFFTDRYPQQKIEDASFSPENMAASTKVHAGFKRIWISVNLPGDEMLWPENFEGPEVDALNVVEGGQFPPPLEGA